MARFDHVDSTIGIVRAPINANFAEADWDQVIPVGLNASGRVVKGAGQTGVIGVVVPGRTVYRAGQVADIMQKGDIVDCAGLAAGTKYYSDAAGVVSTTNTGTYIGYTVEADRLVVAGF
jgi:phage tail protein X